LVKLLILGYPHGKSIDFSLIFIVFFSQYSQGVRSTSSPLFGNSLTLFIYNFSGAYLVCNCVDIFQRKSLDYFHKWSWLMIIALILLFFFPSERDSYGIQITKLHASWCGLIASFYAWIMNIINPAISFVFCFSIPNKERWAGIYGKWYRFRY